MPKEYTHWVLAERISQASSPVIRKITENHKGLYYLGAVAPDTPYYYVKGKDKAEFRLAADTVHGRYNKNPYQIIYDTIKAFPGGIPSPAAAFLLGILSHIVADSIYHPFIYYFCGNIEVGDKGDPVIKKEARIRHYVFETGLDRLYMKEIPLENRGFYCHSLKTKGWDDESFLHFFNLYLFPGQPALARRMRRAICFHSIIQKLFLKRYVYKIIKFLNVPGRGILRSIMALTYFIPINHKVKSLTEKIDYRHPVSGDRKRASIKDLEAEVAEKAGSLFSSLEGVLSESPPAPFEEITGPSLDAGIPYTEDWEMKFFDLGDAVKF